MMRKSTLLFSIALLASVASAAWFWQALRAERARSADLVAQLERQNVEVQRLTDVAASTVANPAPPTAPHAAAQVSTPSVEAPAAQSTVAGGSRQDWDAYRQRLMSDPKYREARRAQERLKYAPRRANLVRLLGFTPEQADAVIDLDIEQMLRQVEKGWNQTGSAQAAKENRAQRETVEREYQDKLRALLGEEKRGRLQGYMESRESRMQVDDLRSELGEANALRDDQVEPLIAALHAERAWAQAELREYRDTLNWEGVNEESWRLHGERKTELMKAMNARMLSSASSLLTQPQLKSLQEQLRQELAQHEAQQRVHRIQAKMQQPAPPEN
jgi:hypothetical protein